MTRSPRRGCAILVLGVLLSPLLARGQDPFNERYFQLPPQPSATAGSLRQVTLQMVQEARRLVDEVNYELAGTVQAQQALPRAIALSQSIERCDDLAGRADPASSALRAAVLQIDPPLQGLRASLANPPGTAPSASRTLYRFDRMYAELQRLTGTYPNNNFTGGGQPNSLAQARNLAFALNSDVGRVQYQVSANGLDRVPPLSYGARDLAGLAVSTQDLLTRIDRQDPLDRIQFQADDVIARTSRLDPLFSQNPQLQAAWSQIVQNTAQLGNLLGRPRPQPPVIQPPIGPAPGGNVLRIVDGWIAEVEQFLAVTGAAVNSVPQGHQIISDGRNLRASLFRFRQQAVSGSAMVQLQGSLREVDNDYRRLRSRIDRIAGGHVGPNIERVRQMESYLNTLRASLLN